MEQPEQLSKAAKTPTRVGQRFTIVKQLGEGGMGTVFKALDERTGRHVALKTMSAPTGDTLLRFKNEYRSLQGIQHVNLVQLGELLMEDDQWWFSMELVDGVDLLSYVWTVSNPNLGVVSDAATMMRTLDGDVNATGRISGFEPTIASTAKPHLLMPTSSSRQSDVTIAASDVSNSHNATMAAPEGSEHVNAALAHTIDSALLRQIPEDMAAIPVSYRFLRPLLDEARLRATIAQLVEGLHALHKAHKVHRDVKPDNVLVTAEGRVIILDFGLIAEQQESEIGIVGTVAYMAPEQARGKPAGPPADWYSVGALLYQALTGQIPFRGSISEILAAKQRMMPPSPRSLWPDIPADLDALCMDLLCTDPAARPKYIDICRCLHSNLSKEAAEPQLDIEQIFVGRRKELEVLERMGKMAWAGSGRTVLLSGESGVGKSAVMNEFAERQLAQTREIIILSGRCYDRESVPYKAVDGVIDALSRHLCQLPENEVNLLLPNRAFLLLQCFPVLNRVPALARAAMETHNADQRPDPQEQRDRVFTSLRQLLCRLAKKVPLLLLIDDLQWTDSDSLALLSHIMTPPDEPAMLLVATIRQGTTVLQRTFMDPALGNKNVYPLQVSRLIAEEARELAQKLLAMGDGSLASDAEQFAEEAAGHPLFIDALVRYASLGATTKSAQLDDVLWNRVMTLPVPAQRLLWLSAVMAGPLAVEMAAAAASLAPEDLDRQVAVLRVQRLLRASTQTHDVGSRSWETRFVEPYHGRVREAIISRLSPEQLRDCHQRLADILEKTEDATPEALVLHCRGSGQLEKAGHHALRAAEKAEQTLAFGHAAQFYRQAMELLQPTGEEARKLRLALAQALINANRGFEAAQELVAAAEGAELQLAAKTRRMAGEQYLRSGHVEQGLALIRQAFADLDLRFYGSKLGILVVVVACTVWLRIRGIEFVERSRDKISARDLARLDLLYACVNVIGSTDIARNLEFSARYLLESLRHGLPSHVVSGFAFRSLVVAFDGSDAGWQLSRTFSERASTLGKSIEDDKLHGLLAFYEGMCHYFVGHWRQATDFYSKADQIFRERCVAVEWETSVCRSWYLVTSRYTGELRRLSTVLKQYMQEAEARSDLFFQSYVGTLVLPMVSLAQDAPERCREETLGWLRRCDAWNNGVREWNAFLWIANSHVYEGDGAAAAQSWNRHMNKMTVRTMRRIQVVRIQIDDLLARCALSSLARNPNAPRQRLLNSVEKRIQSLQNEKRTWGDAIACALRAGVCFLNGDLDASASNLQRAIILFDEAEMKLYATVARRRLGQVLGGDEGKAMITAADAQMRDEEIVVPSRWARMLMPAFPD